MQKVEVLNWSGKKIKELEIKPALLTDKLNLPLLNEVVQWQLARCRTGDHNVKNRAKVSGGGKKPFRQKGTGRARQGSIRSPLLRGGGVAHGPQKRSYDWALPKKIRQKALRNALSYLFQEKKLLFVEDMKIEKAKTKELALKFKNHNWNKALLVAEKHQEEFERACKNLKNFKCLPSVALNVHDLLKFNRVIFTTEVLDTLYKKCGVA